MEEILTALNGKLDYIFCPTSTCGAVRGLAEYVKKRNLSMKVAAVDALAVSSLAERPNSGLSPATALPFVPHFTGTIW
jgi:cysteine synthase A